MSEKAKKKRSLTSWLVEFAEEKKSYYILSIIFAIAKVVCSMVPYIYMADITGEINGITYFLDYYNEYTENIDSSLALFFDLKIDTDGGNLILTDPAGDVIWQPHLSCMRDDESNTEKYRSSMPMKRLYSGDIADYAQLYEKAWPEAMERSVLDFIGSEAAELKARHLRQCEMCSMVTTAAGAPVKIETPYTDSVML